MCKYSITGKAFLLFKLRFGALETRLPSLHHECLYVADALNLLYAVLDFFESILLFFWDEYVGDQGF